MNIESFRTPGVRRHEQAVTHLANRFLPEACQLPAPDTVTLQDLSLKTVALGSALMIAAYPTAAQAATVAPGPGVVPDAAFWAGPVATEQVSVEVLPSHLPRIDLVRGTHTEEHCSGSGKEEHCTSSVETNEYSEVAITHLGIPGMAYDTNGNLFLSPTQAFGVDLLPQLNRPGAPSSIEIEPALHQVLGIPTGTDVIPQSDGVQVKGKAALVSQDIHQVGANHVQIDPWGPWNETDISFDGHQVLIDPWGPLNDSWITLEQRPESDFAARITSRSSPGMDMEVIRSGTALDVHRFANLDGTALNTQFFDSNVRVDGAEMKILHLNPLEDLDLLGQSDGHGQRYLQTDTTIPFYKGSLVASPERVQSNTSMPGSQMTYQVHP